VSHNFKIYSPNLENNSIEENIELKFLGLGFNGIKVKNKIEGNLITAFYLSIPNAIPVSKLLKENIEEEIAFACDVESVNIRRIGRDLVIFVPNKERKIVDFKECLFWYLKDNEVNNMKLPILLGTDFIGNKSVMDLALQPHILIAGSTGSGKSITESSIIASLSMKLNPSNLELYLVDTKRLDLTLFESLPHLKMIAKDEQEWYLLINHLIGEVSARNYKFEKKNVRNIQEYNKLGEAKLPYIVLVIDELADLIEKDKEFRRSAIDKDFFEPKVQDSLRRLIQICRASGVHVIACTQRTSVDVISGVIKANFPTRISLKLPSAIDSKTILDEKGAEKLLGNGDMLIKSQDSDNLKRFHSPFVRLEDIKMILEQREMILNSLGV
jgi:S-DNA-T family DNA segregation ATPase FtsK/SpoIIIE